jgi:putative NIF3 family GTP cyclohydrolase 1 type 2
LPLDAHPTVGNNIQLAQRFGIKNLEPIGDTLVWQGEVDTTLSQLSNTSLAIAGICSDTSPVIKQSALMLMACSI